MCKFCAIASLSQNRSNTQSLSRWRILNPQRDRFEQKFGSDAQMSTVTTSSTHSSHL
ncbi:hypothetical protein ACF3DV_25940 [Chlorogloeopsis fritschii PCC 9212]|uniref:hypothetical protein n=1 Tax=Chlorogloeopsis fritschii TaxID=1124 RepID=UPI0002F9F7AF|nr:hypothetical protein [Chlorogloeopsis fritschii]MBF2009367.1 hypothetical protein [Chlorogloeopsis fritschii C42_A2020_084]